MKTIFRIKMIISLFLLILIVNAIPAFSQDNDDSDLYETKDAVKLVKLKFGLNEPFVDETIKLILRKPDEYTLYKSFFKDYGITHLRYPGGSASHYYFWDDSIPGDSLSNIAVDVLYDYFVDVDSNYSGEYGDKQVNPQMDNYEQFLRFVVAAGIRPSIVLNTVFYHDKGEIHPVEMFTNLIDTSGIDLGLKSNRWEKIIADLKDQVNFTHSIVPGAIVWEIGNEEYRMHDPHLYSKIIDKYTTTIKSLYPKDQVVVGLARGLKKSDDYKKTWNEGVINHLIHRNMLKKIDLFAAHYYSEDIKQINQAEIDQRVRDNFIRKEFIPNLKDFFPKDQVPNFHITETSPLRKTKNPGFNTQLNALVMLDHLLKFYSDPIIRSLTKHTGTGNQTGILFTKESSVELEYVDTSKQDTPAFSYVPPQAHAVRLFFDGMGRNIIDYKITGNYEMLVTEKVSGSKRFIQLLNYSEKPQTVNISKHGFGNYVTHTLPNLKDHHWDTEANKQTGIAVGKILLPPHSFTTITIDNLSQIIAKGY